MAKPWRGPKWGHNDNALGGLRLLILGESHYHETEPVGADVPDMTEYVVRNYVSGNQSHAFLSKVERLVMGDGASWHPADFWDSVVFYNYIPVVAANKSGQRPPEELWHGEAPSLFLDVVKRIEAEAILVCGTTLWRRMVSGLVENESAYSAGGRYWRDREYEVALPYRAVAVHIPHPSGSRGWNYERCLPAIKHLRSRVNEIRTETGIEPLLLKAHD